MLTNDMRPPYVEFKVVCVEDKAKSRELGRRVTKDVDFAFIMPIGGRDCVEKPAQEWFKQMRDLSMSGALNAYPVQWIAQFEENFKLWKQGQAAPLNGTSVKEWAFLSPAQAQNLISIGVLCVEDVAQMTEEAISRYGMGGRALKDKALEWLQERDSVQALREENAQLRADLEKILQRLNTEEAPAKRGRKPKVQAAPQET